MAPFESLPYQLNEKDEVIYLVLKASAWTFKRAIMDIVYPVT